MSVRVLLDTNIVIHREVASPVKEDIGVLYRWLDNLHYIKCLHPLTLTEIEKHGDPAKIKAFGIKLKSYNVLQAPAALHGAVQKACAPLEATANDLLDTQLLNEVFVGHVDLLITEDKKLHRKAALLGLADRVFKVDSFLEKVTAENPDLVDYKVLSVQKELFGRVNLSDPFFDSFKVSYPGFETWFARKSEETAYVCFSEAGITAFLYVKVEDQNEAYPDIEPTFRAKRRLKIGTLKVELNGYKIGERFLKIIFDNAIAARVDEIYVTLFNDSLERQRLASLLEEFGFTPYGVKRGAQGDEQVWVRDMTPRFDAQNPKQTFPFFSRSRQAFIVPIYPEYHTTLFPDSILRTESPADFIEHEPFRNAISKVYVSRSYGRSLEPGDLIVFYRTGGLHHSVVSTIGIVENVVTDIRDLDHFIRLCRKRSVFSDQELAKHWNYSRTPPFVVNFLYTLSLPRRPNMRRLIELGVIADVKSAPRGFERLTSKQLQSILEESQTNDHFIVD